MIPTLSGITSVISIPEGPIMNYVSTGIFQISNYDPTLVYETSLVIGSGTVSFNSSTARYTLSGVNSGFNVVSKYSPSSLPSDPGYMERKAYSYSCRQVTYTEAYGCNCYLDASCGGCTSGPGQCAPGQSQSFGQCGCPGYMCWNYYNGVVCSTCYREVCCQTVCDVLINEPGYTNSGTEWYKRS
jgi:hypothetical protein